jgi:ribosomal subunit interface protein
MQVLVQGQQMDVGASLQTYVSERLTESGQKYFNHAVQANVHFVHETSNRFRSDITLAVGNGIVLKASGAAGEAYPAFDQANQKLNAQLKRYKNRLRDHHKRLNDKMVALGTPANQYVLQAENDDAHHDDANHVAPLVIAETTTHIPTLSVAEAVMRLELSGEPALVFVHSVSNRLNVVHTRADGHIGWIDAPSQTN